MLLWQNKLVERVFYWAAEKHRRPMLRCVHSELYAKQQEEIKYLHPDRVAQLCVSWFDSWMDACCDRPVNSWDSTRMWNALLRVLTLGGSVLRVSVKSNEAWISFDHGDVIQTTSFHLFTEQNGRRVEKVGSSLELRSSITKILNKLQHCRLNQRL